jgi:hypothetical protein
LLIGIVGILAGIAVLNQPMLAAVTGDVQPGAPAVEEVVPLRGPEGQLKATTAEEPSEAVRPGRPSA